MALELVPRVSAEIEEFRGLNIDQQEAFKQPLNERVIKQRPGPGNKQLKYISGKTAIETANRIFGIGKWGYRVLSKSRELIGDKEMYTADIELYVLGCPFPFPGEGVGIPLNSTLEQHEKARKEAVTDGLKRALRHFGDQFGLCLYDEESLVEDSEGNPIQVKNVHPHQQNGHKPATPRTVEAGNGQQTPTVASLREKATGLGLDERKFQKAVCHVLSVQEFPQKFSTADLWKISNALDASAAKRAAGGGR